MSHAQSVIANPGLLGRVLDWIRTRCGEPSELAAWSREELRELAADLSLNEADLVALSSSMADNTVLMERTIRAYGFEPEHLRRSFAPLLHDVERVCSRCHSTGRCRRELDAGTAAAHAHSYCPNAGTFADLVEYTTSS